MMRMAKVLLVDDDVDLVEMNQVVLTHRGHQVQCAYSAAEAKDRLAAERPDVVVLDVMVESELSGVDLVRDIHREMPDLPIVMLSGIHRVKDAAERFAPHERDLRVVRFLDKPASPERVAREIEAILKDR